MRIPTLLTLLAGGSFLTTALPTTPDTSPNLNTLPPRGDSWTADILVYPQPDCRGAPQRFTLGSTEKCHTTAFTFNSLSTTNVGQNMFGRNMNAWGYPHKNCGSGIGGEQPTPFRLTNGANCHNYRYGDAVRLNVYNP